MPATSMPTNAAIMETDVKTTGAYAPIPDPPVQTQDEPSMRGSDAADAARGRLSINVEPDRRHWTARLYERCQNRFDDHPRAFSALFFVPAGLVFAGGGFAAVDDPHDPVTYSLAFAGGATVALFAAVGIWCCRRREREQGTAL